MPYSFKSLAYVTEYGSTSLPSSSALQKVLYTSTSWLTVESPGINPDILQSCYNRIVTKEVKNILVYKLFENFSNTARKRDRPIIRWI